VDFQVRISEAALAEFEEILAWSWANFPEETERFGNSILNHIELLSKFPYIGSPVSGMAGVRQLVHTPILVHYRVHQAPNYVEVLHMRHAGRKNVGS
jgi:plasmid stabilization system protein ParE